MSYLPTSEDRLGQHNGIVGFLFFISHAQETESINILIEKEKNTAPFSGILCDSKRSWNSDQRLSRVSTKTDFYAAFMGIILFL